MRGHMGDSCPQQEDIKGKLGLHCMLRNKDIIETQSLKTYLKASTDEKLMFLSSRFYSVAALLTIQCVAAYHS